MFIEIQEQKFEVLNSFALVALTQKFPNEVNTIFEQFFLGPNFMVNGWFTGHFLKEVCEVFPNNKDYFYNIICNISFIDNLYKFQTPEQIIRFFPEKEEEILRITFQNPQHLIYFFSTCNLDKLKQQNNETLDYLKSNLLSPSLINHLNTQPDIIVLKKIITAFPELNQQLFNLTIGNPTHFRKYIKDVAHVFTARVFTDINKLLAGHGSVDELFEGIKNCWKEVQQKELGVLKKNYTAIESLSNKRILFHRMPKEIKLEIVRMTSNLIDEKELQQFSYAEK